MADEAVFSIKIGTAELDEALAKLAKLEGALKRREVLNAGGAFNGKPANGANSGGGGNRRWVFNGTARTPNKDLDPRILAAFTKASAEGDKHWQHIAHNVEAVRKSFLGLNRLSIGLGSFAKDFAKVWGFATAGSVGAFMAARAAANAFAQSGKTGGSLGLEPGKAEAFSKYFDRFGATTNDLENIENAKQDPDLQTPFFNAGLKQEDIDNNDAEQLWYLMSKKVGNQFAEWEKGGQSYALNEAKNAGYTDLYSPDQLRLLAKHAHDGTLDTAQGLLNANWKSMGPNAKEAQAAADLKAHLDADEQKVQTAWAKAAIELGPHLEKWADAATNWVDKVIGKTADTVNDIANQGDNPGTAPTTRIGLGMAMMGQAFRATPVGQLLMQQQLLGPGYQTPSQDSVVNNALDTIKQLESGGDPNAVSPKGAQGAYQLMPDTAKQYGVNPFNEQQARGAAQQILLHNWKKYGTLDKAFAAYNWGEGNLDKDIKQWGDSWRDHLPDETATYLDKAGKNLYLGWNYGQDQQTSTWKTSKPKQAASPPDFKVIPYDGPAGKQVDASAPDYFSMPAQSVAATGDSLLDRMIAKLDRLTSAGAGAAFRSPDKVVVHSAPASINVHVSAPASNNIFVTGAALGANGPGGNGS